MDLTDPSDRKHLLLRLRALRAQCAASNRFIYTYFATRSNPRAPKFPTKFFATEMHKFFSSPTKVARVFKDPTFLFLQDQPSLSQETINALGTITTLILVKNYTPHGLDFAQLTALQKLVMLDGDMTDALRTAIQNLAKGPRKLQYLNIPHWGTPILAADAFSCTSSKPGSLAHVTMNDITEIANGVLYQFAAFAYNPITSVSFPSLTRIGEQTFRDTPLRSAYFPAVVTIEGTAFPHCQMLTSAIFPMAKSIGSSAFHNCQSLKTTSFPLVTKINTHAFFNCLSLNSVSFPEATYIGNTAFIHCRTLTSIYIPKMTAANLAANAFQYCPSTLVISPPVPGYTFP
ncbi:MAG: leucine-rich repeat domain-containing protein [Holosporales bacterium]|nr:leucine-rich repeat domain-containing protein [Holosporales bacterium]